MGKKLKLERYKLDVGAGYMSLQILVIGFTAIILLSGFIVWTDSYVSSVVRSRDNAQAFTIAEAGIEYYRWHLAHAPADFQDGTGSPGPYVHPYFDKDGIRIGQFELEITPPEVGSTIVAIRSSGRVDADPTVVKILQVRLGLPSFAKYSVVSNSDVRLGEGTEVYGQLHSNGGIRFDGVAYNIVTSARDTYDDPDHSGANEFGVHTHVAPTDPLPPATAPVREDVFKAGRDFPVPAVDFAGITQDLANLKTLGQTSEGYYRGPAGSGRPGYEIVLQTDDRFDLYRVNSVESLNSTCTSWGSSQPNWGSWSVRSRTLLESNRAFPANGVIFIEDNVWVRGQVDTARLTIAAGRFPVNPSTYKSITINGDLTYTNYDGSDVIALLAQDNINIGFYSEDDLRVDAAVIAQNGRVGRYYYGWVCGSQYVRDKITMFGMIGSNNRYGFAYTDGTGYQDRVLIYDGNLLYGPPPEFPTTGDQYEIITWEEIK